MKTTLIAVVVCLVCTPAIGHAAFGVGLYTDAALTQCTLADNSPAVVNIHVAATSNDGATGIRFRITESPGFTGVWLSETTPFFPVGNSRTDLSLGFPECFVGNFAFLSMTYQLFGTSTCSTVSGAPAEGFSVGLCQECIFHEITCRYFDALHVNCSGSFNCSPVSAESSTWGRVKALYR